MVWGLLKPCDPTIEHIEHCHNFLQMDTDSPELSLRLSNLWVIRKETTRDWKLDSASLLDPWVPLLAAQWRICFDMFIPRKFLFLPDMPCHLICSLAAFAEVVTEWHLLIKNNAGGSVYRLYVGERLACMELTEICSFLKVISDIFVESFLCSLLLFTANILFFQLCLLTVFVSSKWTFSKKSLTLNWLIF